VPEDYYEILGVERTASTAEIKRAYRRLARQYHPDVANRDPQAEALFKKISEAYAVLSDPAKRRQYDLQGSAAVDMFFQNGFPDIFEIFRSAFGDMPFGHPSARQRGQSLRVEATVSLQEVLTGTTREVKYTRVGVCGHCEGTGVEPGTTVRRCPTCGGSGQVRQHRQTFMGSLTTIGTCPECGGRGEVVEQSCEECRGQGVTRQHAHLEVEIPPGIEAGRELVVEGGGNAVPGGRAGDLHVHVRVGPHELFERHGQDLATQLAVSFSQATLGTIVEAPALAGTVELKIPAGTQSGTQLTISSQGLPPFGGGRRGDLLVRVQVATPTHLTPRQKQLLEEFARESGESINTKEEGLFERIREALGG